MDNRHEAEGVDHDRRAALLLGLAGVTAAVVGQGSEAAAQQAGPAPGLSVRTVAEVPSTVPGYAMVRLVEVTFEPGAKGPPMTMNDPMVCEMGRGELDETKNDEMDASR